MGWSNGDLVFEPVADILTRSAMDPDLKTEICEALIKGAQECGWDCESESLGRYLDDSAIVEAFARCGITREEEDG